MHACIFSNSNKPIWLMLRLKLLGLVSLDHLYMLIQHRALIG